MPATSPEKPVCPAPRRKFRPRMVRVGVGYPNRAFGIPSKPQPPGYARVARALREVLDQVAQRSTDSPAAERRLGGARRAFLGVAAIAVAQVIGGTAVLASDWSYPRWRLVAVGGLGILTIILGALELVVLPSGSRAPRRLALPLLAILAFASMSALIGGVASPFVPLLFHVPIGQAARRGRDGITSAAAAAAITCCIVLTFLPEDVVGPAIAEPQRSIVWALMFTGVLASLVLEVSSVRHSYAAAAQNVEKMGEELLRGHEERVRGLEAIGARVAHELKNPLTSIKSLLALQQDDATDESSRRRLEVVQREVARMQRIIQDYLSFSRPLDKLRVESIDLFTIASRVVDVLRARADKADIELVLSGSSVPLRADGHQLQGALLNFVANALEATPARGTVGIKVSTSDGKASVLVRDTGRGLTPEQLQKIGTPFFTTKESGTGLGVVVAKATVEQHGGSIHYETTEGRGTTLTLELPLDAAPGEDSALSSYESLAHLDRTELEKLKRESKALNAARRQARQAKQNEQTTAADTTSAASEDDRHDTDVSPPSEKTKTAR